MEANGSSSGGSSDSAPDCWDQADLEPGPAAAASASPADGEAPGPAAADGEEAGAAEELGAAFSRHLSLHARPFVPNVHAAEFVPAFMRGPADPTGRPATPPQPPAPGEAGGERRDARTRVWGTRVWGWKNRGGEAYGGGWGGLLVTSGRAHPCLGDTCLGFEESWGRSI
uniref:eukaryotic peptide chain release factor GTP-binding subunit ERF3A-like n=1 Tax=Euleptes europaea TaxID=460621 RepID=UPI00253F95CE|nr:eukaryotic peptide chain release factor GTP-binding subunit ERF3A-like [Euleptes europaea]